jgi:GxxExxY protein
MDEHRLTEKIVSCAAAVHTSLGVGRAKGTYRNALENALAKAGLALEAQKPIRVHCDGIHIGEFEADLLVEGRILLELKAAHSLTSAHEFQLVNYLAATGIETGILLNFGPSNLEYKRKFRSDRRR